MKYNLELLKADIKDEIDSLRDDVARLSSETKKPKHCEWPRCNKPATGNAGSNGPMCSEHFAKAFDCVENEIDYCECGDRTDCCKCSSPKLIKLRW